MNEEWRTIDRFPGYSVSSLGRQGPAPAVPRHPAHVRELGARVGPVDPLGPRKTGALVGGVDAADLCAPDAG